MEQPNDKQLEGLAKLREVFAPNQIGKLPRVTCKACSDNKQQKHCGEHKRINCNVCGNWISEKHIHLDYVNHAVITARLLDVDPLWTWEPAAVDPNTGAPVLDREGGLWIKLTVCGVTRYGYGDAGGKTGANAVKEAVGDALRNSAMRFGAALDLWAKGDLDAKDEEPSGSASQQRAPRPVPSGYGGEDPQGAHDYDAPPKRNSSQQRGNFTKALSTKAKKADPETGEVLEPLTSLLAKLDEQGTKFVEEQMEKANYPAIDKLPKGAENQVRRWAAVELERMAKEKPFS